MTKPQEKDVQDLLARVDKVTKERKLDLSSDEDLSIGIMNLISIEEHLHFTAQKTGKDSYYELLREVREMRKDLLKTMIKEYEGEVWCISKHLLASSMRLMEVGTKQLGKGNNKEAKGLFEKSYHLYSLFWALNLNIIRPEQAKTQKLAPKDEPPVEQASRDSEQLARQGFFNKLGEAVKRAVDCCKE